MLFLTTSIWYIRWRNDVILQQNHIKLEHSIACLAKIGQNNKNMLNKVHLAKYYINIKLVYIQC